MRIAALLSLILLTACASEPPTPLLIPSESQVEQGSAEPAKLPAQ